MPGVQMNGNTFPVLEEPQVTRSAGLDREPDGSDSRRPVAGLQVTRSAGLDREPDGSDSRRPVAGL